MIRPNFRPNFRSSSRFGPVLSRAGLCTIATAAIGLSLLAGGCSLPPSGKTVISGLDAGINGAMAVDVDNVRGSVEVIADPSTAKPELVVLRMGDGAPVKTDEYVAAHVVQGDFGSVLRVVSADTARGAAPMLHLRIRVPACDGLRVHASGGGVDATGVGGAIDIKVENTDASAGGVRLQTTRAINQPFTVEAPGSVRIEIPATSGLDVTAKAPEGVAKLVTNSAQVRVRKPTMHAYEATVGAGGAPLSVTSTHGDVLIFVKP